MKKKLIRFTTALMAAVVVMASPITAKADEISDIQARFNSAPSEEAPADGIAREGVKYALNEYGFGYSVEDAFTKIFVMFSNMDASTVNQNCNNMLASYNKAGYEWKCVYVSSLYPGDYYYNCGVNLDERIFTLNIPTAFGVIDDNDFYANNDFSNLIGENACKYDFSVNYNGTDYTECTMIYIDADRGAVGNDWFYGDYICYLLPEGYNGGVNVPYYYREDSQDDWEESYLTYPVSGSSAPAAQPVVPETSAPTVPTTPIAAPESPAPAASAETVSSRQGTVYTTKKGDNLSKIAKELYNDSGRWRDIYELNKNIIKNPNNIYSNMQLMLP